MTYYIQKYQEITVTLLKNSARKIILYSSAFFTHWVREERHQSNLPLSLYLYLYRLKFRRIRFPSHSDFPKTPEKPTRAGRSCKQAESADRSIFFPAIRLNYCLILP
jgi:hypothetical protein